MMCIHWSQNCQSVGVQMLDIETMSDTGDLASQDEIRSSGLSHKRTASGLNDAVYGMLKSKRLKTVMDN